MNFFLCRQTDDIFEVYVTIDIAAESNKISGNELRDILYNEAKVYHKFGDHTISTKEFSITNLEGKLVLRPMLAPSQLGDESHHSFASCIIFICLFYAPAYCLILSHNFPLINYALFEMKSLCKYLL